ncbi:hypothetical protein ScPMuIL_013148 [Solemya velum]
MKRVCLGVQLRLLPRSQVARNHSLVSDTLLLASWTGVVRDESRVKMSGLPRLSSALRAFSSLSPAKEGSDIQKELTEKRFLLAKKKENEGMTWSNLVSKLKKDADVEMKDLNATLKELLHCTRNIVGQDASTETVESSAAYIFDVFKSADKVSHKETMSLKSIFGPFPATEATNACAIVNHIASWLPEEMLSWATDGTDCEMDAPQEFGKNIKFKKPAQTSYHDSSSDSEEEVERPQYDLKYSEKKMEKSIAPVVPDSLESFNKSWLESEVSKYFSTEFGLGMGDLCTTIFDVLISPKTDEALQNDLFELLGFDRFELIESLLQNRKKLIGAANKETMNASRKKTEPRSNYGCQVTIQSEQEKQIMKQMRREEKKQDKRFFKGDGEDFDQSFNPADLRAQREAALRAASSAPLFSGKSSYTPREKYPNVYDQMEEARQSSAFVGGVKMSLPLNFERRSTKEYEEVNIPPSDAAPTGVGATRILIESLDEIGQLAFKHTKSLNRIQSVVFETAYKTNENLLICAPTGAGKTNIAMLTILHEIKQHISQGVIKKDEFKVIYVAPMKALAAEMVRNFGGRLEPLGIAVRELTGDMSLTKSEILKTQMLVTTPEKWDVVTRKSTGDVALAQLVKLLIIDEVHLLHDDRGSVIESLVARTLRQVESSQNMIRIIGLSATLPNYLDVARFLHVNPYHGLFFFDGRFRPVPLGQTFIGVKATNRVQQMLETNNVCYEKVLTQVKKGYQVMVFVHARNDTVRTSNVLCEMAKNNGDSMMFLPEQSQRYGDALKHIARSRNKPLKELFSDGFGIHHAGMLRQDRNLVEKYFSDGFIKVLCCTATLAWGVNLPAHAVIIKGTQLYDAKRGAFVDLGILDVMQIFGRAGRPQFDKFGHGTIITTHDKLSHYLSLMTRQNPIESQFIGSLTDNLNAEIALGTVTNVDEAVKWLSYTYLYVRMRCNPLVYGINYNKIEVFNMNEFRHAMAFFIVQLCFFSAHYIFSTGIGFFPPITCCTVFNNHLRLAPITWCTVLACSSFSHFSEIKEIIQTLENNGTPIIVCSDKVLTYSDIPVLKELIRACSAVDPCCIVSEKFGVMLKKIISILYTVPNYPITKKILVSIYPMSGLWVKTAASPHQNPCYNSMYFLRWKYAIDLARNRKYKALSNQSVYVSDNRLIEIENCHPDIYLYRDLGYRPHTELNILLFIAKEIDLDLNNNKIHIIYQFTHNTYIFFSILHTHVYLFPISIQYLNQIILPGSWSGSSIRLFATLMLFSRLSYASPNISYKQNTTSPWNFPVCQTVVKYIYRLTNELRSSLIRVHILKSMLGDEYICCNPFSEWQIIAIITCRDRHWTTRQWERYMSRLVLAQGNDRGPVLEVIVSRTNFISSHTEKPVRVVGLSTALANARDLADWLAIGQMGLYNFRPSVRPVPLEVHIHGFPGQHYCPRMATMNKPTFQAVKTHSPDKPVLVFVSSRRQTRLTALDLIAFLAAEDNPKQWLRMPEMEMENIITAIKDTNLKLTLAFGIGIHHAGLIEWDRKSVEELFVNQKIQLLIATSTLAWGVNFPAHLVVVKGTEYYDGKTKRYVDFPITDVLQMMGRAGRPQFDDQGKAVILVHDIKKHFYKKFLYEPFPVESSLLEVLPEHLNAEIIAGTITSKQDALDYITWTYFFRRLIMNPRYDFFSSCH